MRKTTLSFDRFSRSLTYLLPLLGDSYKDFTNLLNVYYGHNSFPDEKYKLYLMFNKKEDCENSGFMDWLTHHELYNRVEYYNDDYFMVVFNLHDYDHYIYDLFVEGKYSQLPEYYKQHILKFHSLTKLSIPAKVLYRSEEHYLSWEKLIGETIPRDQEIGNKPNHLEEVFSKELMFKEEMDSGE